MAAKAASQIGIIGHIRIISHEVHINVRFAVVQHLCEIPFDEIRLNELAVLAKQVIVIWRRLVSEISNNSGYRDLKLGLFLGVFKR